jgi:hypothetical protein
MFTPIDGIYFCFVFSAFASYTQCIYIYIYKRNCTLSKNIKLICASFRNEYKSELFRPVSQRVQINLISSDNVNILWLSLYVKKSKTTSKLSEKSRSKLSSNRFQWCSISHPSLYSYHFLLLLYMNQIPE